MHNLILSRLISVPRPARLFAADWRAKVRPAARGLVLFIFIFYGLGIAHSTAADWHTYMCAKPGRRAPGFVHATAAKGK